MSTYDLDFHAWAVEQADAVRRRSANEIDWDNLAEELDSLGRSQKSELHSRYLVLLTHLLKWMCQPGFRSRSWRSTIAEQRRAIAKHLRENPSLQAEESEEFGDAYIAARAEAEAQTGLSPETFPEQPPFSSAQAMSADFWPGGDAPSQ